MARSPRPWWDQVRHADRRPLLLTRNAIRRALSEWFEARGFLEVEPAVLQVSPGNETHLAGFATEVETPDGRRARAFLPTSPEFACKKLLAAGEPRIYTFARAFRNGERGRLHAPEFTMLEWYRTQATFEALLDDCAAILDVTARAAGIRAFRSGGRSCPADVAPERLSVADAFARYARIDLDGHLRTTAGGDRDAFARLAEEAGHRVSHDDDWSDIFAKVLTGAVEPHLGCERPTLLTHYPASEAALANVSRTDPLYADRVELYVCGVELANGYDELCDPAEQLRRFENAMREAERRYRRSYPIDDEFIAALDMMPPAVGCALGFDRLVMLATGAPSVDAVAWTPVAAFGAAAPSSG
ncbi:MAG: EF-P lysine aminoacylase EpmA [Hyphomicrobiaceae bacterium]